MKKEIEKVNSNSVSLAGEFAVLSQLALRNFDANMTLGNTKGVDILISNPKNNKMYKLEVKTTRKNLRSKPSASKNFGEIVCEWIMSEKHEAEPDPDLLYCFVNIEKETDHFHFYIVPSNIVAKYIRDEHSFWLKASPKHRQNSMRQFRIGLKSGSYKIDTPFIEDYENNWGLFNK